MLQIRKILWVVICCLQRNLGWKANPLPVFRVRTELNIDSGACDEGIDFPY